MKRSKKIVWKVRYAMYKQRLWTNSQTTGGSWNRSCPKETTDITIIPIIINPKRIERAFRLSFTKTINPKTTRIISVTTLSIFAKSQGEYSETSMIFTKKSSFVYLHQRFRKENGLVVKSNEVLELDTASRNAITMA